MFLLSGCTDAKTAAFSPLFKDSYVGVEIHVEKINNPISDEIFILYKKTDRLSKKVEYKLLKIGVNGRFDSLQLDFLTNSKKVKIGNIGFTAKGNPILSLVNDEKINLLEFKDQFKSFEIREIPSDKKINSVYYLNDKVYVFITVGNSMELNVYEYSVENPVAMIKKKTLKLDSILSIKDGLFLQDETFLFLVESITTKGSSVKLATIGAEINDVLYLDLNTGYDDTNLLESTQKSNFVSLFLEQRMEGRIKNYSALLFDVQKQKIVIKLSEKGNFKWVDVLNIESDAFISLEVEKSRVTKKYSIFCNNLTKANRIKFEIEELGVEVLRRFYSDAFLLKSSGEGYLATFVYSELRGRTTFDVFAIVEIESEICK